MTLIIMGRNPSGPPPVGVGRRDTLSSGVDTVRPPGVVPRIFGIETLVFRVQVSDRDGDRSTHWNAFTELQRSGDKEVNILLMEEVVSRHS